MTWTLNNPMQIEIFLMYCLLHFFNFLVTYKDYLVVSRSHDFDFTKKNPVRVSFNVRVMCMFSMFGWWKNTLGAYLTFTCEKTSVY